MSAGCWNGRLHVLLRKSSSGDWLHSGSASSNRTPTSLFLNEQRLGLVTDLYELTMAAAYWSAGLAEKRATFDLFFRE